VIKFVESKNIDTSRWDELVRSSTSENVFSYSWYLSAVSENWGAVIVGDYESVMPVTYTSKLGVNQCVQASFTREFEVLGSDLKLNNVLPILKSRFKNVQFRTGSKLNNEVVERSHQYLNLNGDFKSGFSTNAKRLIKKSAKSYTYKVICCIGELIELVNENIAHKIKEFTPSNILRLQALMKAANNNESGETIAVYENDRIVGAGFFLKDKSRITYLKGASTDEAKKKGAMFGLMDFAFQYYKADFNVFDFGGSDIESVANFYRKFGAKDREYYELQINNLPFWFKGLKKLKG